MAVKGVALIKNIQNESASTFKVEVDFIGMDTSSFGSTILDGVSPGLTSLQFEAAIKQAVKDDLVANYGFSFGLFDTVLLIGGTL